MADGDRTAVERRDDDSRLTSARTRPHSSLKELAASEIRERIFSGNLRPSSKVDQEALADDLQMSKLPVREALITLESEGLIRNIPRRGAFVASLTRDDIRDHYHIFGLVAGLAAERAAENLDEDELAELEDMLERMESSDSPETQQRLNEEFHRLINLAGGSRRLASVVKLLGKSLPSRFYEFYTGWAEPASEDHRQIVTALKRRKPDAASSAMVEHFRHGGEHAVRFLESTGFWDHES